MTRFGDGIGIDVDLVRAAEVATEAALAPLQGRTPDLVLTFVCGPTEDAIEAAGERVASLVPGAVVLGCSVGGVIGGGRGVEGAGAVSVWAGILPGARIRSFHLEVMPSESGRAVMGMPQRGEDDDVAILLTDPFSFPAESFVPQADSTLAGLPLVGGIAAGPAGPGSTRLFVAGRTVNRGAAGVLLAGVEFRTLVSQGCRPVGPVMTVTAAEGNVVLGLAGHPAKARLEQLLAELDGDDQALASQGLHLGIAADEYSDEHDYLVRTIVGVQHETDGLVLGDAVEVGQTVRFQVRDADAAADELRRMLARWEADAPFSGALLFSCNGRGAQLFGDFHSGADHDVTAVRDALATQAVAGFFAAREFGPVAGHNAVHSLTASLLVFP